MTSVDIVDKLKYENLVVEDHGVSKDNVNDIIDYCN